jgi:hypothetical protein
LYLAETTITTDRQWNIAAGSQRLTLVAVTTSMPETIGEGRLMAHPKPVAA